MSKVGKVPVKIPDGVKVTVGQVKITVEGKYGRLETAYRPDMVEIAVDDGAATVSRRKEGKAYRAYHGLYRSLLANMVHGVAERWEKVLLVKGLGYRARLQGRTLILDLGYSNPKEYELPEDIEAELPNPNEIIIRGADKQRVGQVAAEIRALRKPNVYDGKGIRYRDEQVLLKAGKLGGQVAG
ncbi:50S ribosomal protein L6 [Candidatus Acetothermia bacterium]|nr:MAG: 50S ribosomal protein L6 [Candidatus Acetothermia bacterium]